MIADDLFAGAGGWDFAARELGIHARGVENMKEARATRDAAGLTTIHDDVWTYVPDGNATGLIASPPCQTFSAAGKGSGRKALEDVLRGIRDNYVGSLDHLHFLGEEVGDNRTALVLTPLHFALAGGYEWLAWEQVPTVLPVWEACAERLRAEGWNVWTGLLHAEQYGVPQTRKRAFLLASRTGPVAPPTPTHSRYYSRSPEKLDPGVEKWVSMAEALGWSGSAPTHMGDVYNSHGCIRPMSAPAPTITASMDNGNFRWHSVMAPAGTSSTVVDPRPISHPAGTITGSGTAEWGSRIGRAPALGCRDPRGVRLEVDEAGKLQSFPADYPWQGTKSKRYLQCGNAVPPDLALAALSAVAPAVSEAVA